MDRGDESGQSWEEGKEAEEMRPMQQALVGSLCSLTFVGTS